MKEMSAGRLPVYCPYRDLAVDEDRVVQHFTPPQEKTACPVSYVWNRVSPPENAGVYHLTCVKNMQY